MPYHYDNYMLPYVQSYCDDRGGWRMYTPDYHKGDVCYPTNWDVTRHCWPHLFIAEHDPVEVPHKGSGQWFYHCAYARDYRKATIEDAESAVSAARDARDKAQAYLDKVEALAKLVMEQQQTQQPQEQR